MNPKTGQWLKGDLDTLGLDMGGIRTQTIFRDEALEMRMILAQLGHEAFGGMACAIIFGRTVRFHQRCGHERHHFTDIRMANRCAQPLMRVRDRPVAVDLGQTRRTMNRWGGKIPRAIAGPSRVTIQQYHVFKRLASLELPKDALE
jgi:hypothetical protein